MSNDKNRFVLYESAMARMERANARLWVVVLALTVALALSHVFSGGDRMTHYRRKIE